MNTLNLYLGNICASLSFRLVNEFNYCTPLYIIKTTTDEISYVNALVIITNDILSTK
jgi:hypothetical protein